MRCGRGNEVVSARWAGMVVGRRGGGGGLGVDTDTEGWWAGIML